MSIKKYLEEDIQNYEDLLQTMYDREISKPIISKIEQMILEKEKKIKLLQKIFELKQIVFVLKENKIRSCQVVRIKTDKWLVYDSDIVVKHEYTLEFYYNNKKERCVIDEDLIYETREDLIENL